MIFLDVEGVEKHFGPEPVLDGVTFEVRPGQRIGLVGPNGSGKTTLLRILAEKDDPDNGRIVRHPSLHCGYLEQQPQWEPGRTLWNEAQSALAGLIAIEQEAVAVAADMAESSDPDDHARLAARYDHLQHELHQRDAYNLEHKIERILDGLRFRRESFTQPVASLSGGEQNRLLLAKLLLAEPNLMLLDEPSNHLDIEATQWLEGFLIESSAAMILVSHDRYFLDKVTNRTFELFQGTVDSYVGNFSAYWQQKGERLLVEQRTYERQQTEIAKAKEFIRRNHYGQKHAQAEDRRKKLERIVLVAPPREIAAPRMRFPEASRSGDIVVRAMGLRKAFERTLFSDVNVQVTLGERWGLLGPNGSGKTTFLRCLLGQEKPDAGEAKLGQGVVVGYFDQQLAELDDDTLVVDAIRPTHKEMKEQERRDLLAKFGVTGDTAMQKVGSLSGGERCRAALARLAAADANFLVLDEPTNHLDLWARDALERAIRAFDGTVLFVSHDRYFVNRAADHLMILDAGGVRVVEGNYDTYQQILAAKASSRDDEEAAEPARTRDRESSSQKTQAKTPERPKRRFPYRKVADIETEIAEREATIARLHQELGEEATYRDGNRVRQIKIEIAQQQEAVKGLYEHWEEAVELNW